MKHDGDLTVWDAAYILGALSPEERVEYERFLSAEPAQIVTLTELTEISNILNVLSPEEAFALIDEGVGTPVIDHDAPSSMPSLGVVADKRRRRSQPARLLTLFASAAAFLVIGGIIGYTVVPHESAPGASLQAMAPGQRAGITAALALSAEEWGTRLDWGCQYTKDWATGVASYDLIVTTKDGRESAVASWSPAGGQTSGLAASTAIPASQIRTVEIRVTGTATPLAVTTVS
jgi:hypothetical protein